MDSFRKPVSTTVDSSRAQALSETLTLHPLMKQKETQPLNYTQEVNKLGEVAKDLKKIEERVMQTELDCYKMNIDLVTKFDPYFIEKIRAHETQCDKVIDDMTTTLNALESRMSSSVRQNRKVVEL